MMRLNAKIPMNIARLKYNEGKFIMIDEEKEEWSLELGKIANKISEIANDLTDENITRYARTCANRCSIESLKMEVPIYL